MLERYTKYLKSQDEDYEEQSHPHEYTMDPHGGDLLLGSSPRSLELRSQHPEPIQGFRLWQAYLDNFNPLTKVLHAPTVQQALLEATGNLDDVSKSMEALMFAIYSCAVYSMSNSECENVTGGTKPFVLTKYQCATRQALVSAGLLRTSNMVVLQAYTLFLVSKSLCRQQYLFSHSVCSFLCVYAMTAIHCGRSQVWLCVSPREWGCIEMGRSQASTLRNRDAAATVVANSLVGGSRFGILCCRAKYAIHGLDDENAAERQRQQPTSIDGRATGRTKRRHGNDTLFDPI